MIERIRLTTFRPNPRRQAPPTRPATPSTGPASLRVRASPTSPGRHVALGAVVALIACTAGNGSPSPAGGSSGATSLSPTVLSIRTTGYRLAAPIERTVAVRDGGRVFIAGGLDSTGTTVGGVFLLNPVSGTLRGLGSLPTPVHDAAGVMLGSRLFVFGGGSSSGTDLVQVFDAETRTGSVAGHLPVAVSDLAAASIGGTTYLVGGYDGHAPRREIYATTDGSSFRQVGSLPVGLRYPAVAAVGNTVIVAGGQKVRGLSSAIYAFDPASGVVKVLGSLPEAIGHAAAFSLQGSVYVLGGMGASGAPVATVTRVDVATGAAIPQPEMSAPLSDAAVAAGSTDAIVVGGSRGGGAVNEVSVATLRTVPAAPSDSPGSVSSAGPTSSPVAGDAAVRPFAGLLLIADRGNNRLLVMNAKKRIVWRYPAPNLPKPPHPLYFPDDAFWVHGGHAILVNEEENETLIEIAYPSGKVLWSYGHPRVPGSAPGYLYQPDDVYPYPGGGVVVADAKNCRILFLDENGIPSGRIGRSGACAHGLPHTVGYPNGDTPLSNGHLLLSELNGHWVDEVTRTGRVLWAHQIPGVVEPSDPQPMADGSFMVASYAHPGAVVIFDRRGKVLWSYHPASGPGVLDHPSLAAPLPNGLVAVNDDYNHRVVLIDRRTKRIVWQYGRTGVPGTAAGLLSFPDGLDLLLPGNVVPLHVDFASTAIQHGRP